MRELTAIKRLDQWIEFNPKYSYKIIDHGNIIAYLGVLIFINYEFFIKVFMVDFYFFYYLLSICLIYILILIIIEKYIFLKIT